MEAPRGRLLKRLHKGLKVGFPQRQQNEQFTSASVNMEAPLKRLLKRFHGGLKMGVCEYGGAKLTPPRRLQNEQLSYASENMGTPYGRLHAHTHTHTHTHAHTHTRAQAHTHTHTWVGWGARKALDAFWGERGCTRVQIHLKPLDPHLAHCSRADLALPTD